jgi:hypothetical protein
MNTCASGRTIFIGLRAEGIICCVLVPFEVVYRSGVVWYFLGRFAADRLWTKRVAVLFSLPENSKEFICSLSQKL